jgi:hypothetical protein
MFTQPLDVPNSSPGTSTSVTMREILAANCGRKRFPFMLKWRLPRHLGIFTWHKSTTWDRRRHLGNLLRICVQNMTFANPWKPNIDTRLTDYPCWISFRTITCASIRNFCIGARPTFYLCLKLCRSMSWANWINSSFAARHEAKLCW